MDVIDKCPHTCMHGWSLQIGLRVGVGGEHHDNGREAVPRLRRPLRGVVQLCLQVLHAQVVQLQRDLPLLPPASCHRDYGALCGEVWHTHDASTAA